MRIVTSSYLVDSPLMPREPRDNAILNMAEALVEHVAYADRGDAVRCLCTLGFNIQDVFCVVDEAIAQARQAVVAREMGAS